jgi:hypothetical protein
MEDKNFSLTTTFTNQDETNLTPINTAEKIIKYEDKIRKIMLSLQEEGKEDFDRKILKDLIDFELFLDEELVSRIHNTHKLNLHLSNILKDNNFTFNESENN